MVHGFKPEHLARIMGGLMFWFMLGLVGGSGMLIVPLFAFLGVAVACYCAVAASVKALRRAARRERSSTFDGAGPTPGRALAPPVRPGRALAPPVRPGRALAPPVRPGRQLPPGPSRRGRLGGVRPAAAS